MENKFVNSRLLSIGIVKTKNPNSSMFAQKR